MQQAEFDKFAEEYRSMHAGNIRASGEAPEFFAEYKVRDVARALAQNPPATILDFGGGIGTSVPYFNKYFPDAALTCLDVSERSLTIARERFPGLANFEQFDGKTLPFPDNAFDVAFAACVFHHIEPADRQHLVQELYRTIAPGGKFFIFEHNPLNPLTVQAVNTCPFDENASLLRAGAARKLLSRAGFQNTSIHFRIFFPNALRQLRWLEQYLKWLPLGAQYIACGRKPNRN